MALSLLVAIHQWGLAEGLRCVATVQGDLQVAGRDRTRKLHLEVEPGTDKELGAVDRIDRLGGGWQTRHHGEEGKDCLRWSLDQHLQASTD